MLSAIARLVTVHPRRILISALVFGVVSAVIGAPVAGKMKAGSDNFEDPASSSVVARAALARATGANPEPDLIALARPGGDVRRGGGAAHVARLGKQIASEPGVASVASYATTHDPGLVARDARSTYLAVFFKRASGDSREALARRIDKRLGHTAQTTFGGQSLAPVQVSHTVSADLGRAELLAFPILFLLSLWVFRGLIAAGLPPLLGGLSIVGALLGLRVVSQFLPLSVFALNLVIGVGLGLSIDYSLFIISRYREELARVGSGREAVRRTLATAGRTVAFSSLTVIAALACLLVFPQRFLYSMGIGGMIVTLIAAALALVALPAALVVLGPRINALAPKRWQRQGLREARSEGEGAWFRLSRAVMRRPLPIAVVASTLLIVLGLPSLDMRFRGLDPSVLPTSASARQVYDALATQFPPNRTTPISIAVNAPRSAASEVARYAAQLHRLAGVAAVARPRPLDAGTWQLDVVSRGGQQSGTSQRLVSDIRAVSTPLRVQVGGATARFVDQQASLADHIPLALALLAVTTLLLLFAMTGSVVLPLKALLMNLLTLSAALGILVFIFQDGRLQGLLGYTSQRALDSTQPILLFAIAFGLSTDYGVFLLTRIKEARDAGAGEKQAVAIGLERTGRIVTAAALLFCVAIGAFATSRLVFIKELGVGTALAVLIDATIVRALLVPSLMALLGRRNWWAPGPLRRLYERLGLSETEASQPLG